MTFVTCILVSVIESTDGAAAAPDEAIQIEDIEYDALDYMNVTMRVSKGLMLFDAETVRGAKISRSASRVPRCRALDGGWARTPYRIRFYELVNCNYSESQR